MKPAFHKPRRERGENYSVEPPWNSLGLGWCLVSVAYFHSWHLPPASSFITHCRLTAPLLIRSVRVYWLLSGEHSQELMELRHLSSVGKVNISLMQSFPIAPAFLPALTQHFQHKSDMNTMNHQLGKRNGRIWRTESKTKKCILLLYKSLNTLKNTNLDS